MRRLNWLLALTALATIAAAQADTIRIRFPEPGERQVWTGSLGSVGEPTAVQATGDAIEVRRPEADEYAFVHDTATGNVYIRSGEEIGDEPAWEFSADEEPDYAYQVSVQVEHEGELVANGIVLLRSGEDERTSLLGPDDEGMASFHLVPFGDVEVEFQYDFEGEDRTTPTQIFVLEPGRIQPIPLFSVAVTDEVETLTAEEVDDAEGDATEPAPGTSRTDDLADPAPRSSPFSRILGYLLGLAIVGGVIYFAYRYLTQNPDKVKEGLSKLGMDPGTPDGGDAGAQAPAPPQKAEVKPIVLDDAEPGAAPSPTNAPAAAPVGPALVSDSGRLDLREGTNMVGREGEVDVLVGDETVSRNHAEIVLEPDATILRDLGSTNGTYVNGQKIEGDTMLKPGDSVQFGKAQFRFER